MLGFKEDERLHSGFQTEVEWIKHSDSERKDKKVGLRPLSSLRLPADLDFCALRASARSSPRLPARLSPTPQLYSSLHLLRPASPSSRPARRSAFLRFLFVSPPCSLAHRSTNTPSSCSTGHSWIILACVRRRERPSDVGSPSRLVVPRMSIVGDALHVRRWRCGGREVQDFDRESHACSS